MVRMLPFTQLEDVDLDGVAQESYIRDYVHDMLKLIEEASDAALNYAAKKYNCEIHVLSESG